MYSFDSRIRYSETGRDRRLTIPMLLNYFQDCSTMHTEELGIGLDYLAPQNKAWVLNFWQVDVTRLPGLGERVRIHTHPYEFRGVMGMRNYLMTDEEGKRLAVANTIYTLLNMEKHVPVRPDDKILGAYRLEEKLDMEYLPRKIVFEGDGDKKEPVTVARHHIDTNDHVNNVQYVNMAFDLLPAGIKVSRVCASYHISAMLGDVIEPVVYDDGDTFGVDLQREDGESFSRIKLYKV